MQLPFEAADFTALFERYNEAIWPAQIIAYLLAGVVVALPYLAVPHANRIISGTLAIFWLWTGLVFLALFYRALNGMTAVAFGFLLAFQGVLFVYAGVMQDLLHFRGGFEPSKFLGTFLILYALLIYPVLGAWAGHGYPRAPLFGVAPCPTTIFSFGILLWASPKLPRYLLIIPLLWSLVGVGAALALGIYEDAMMPVAGVLSTIIILIRGRGSAVKPQQPRPQVS